MKYHITKEGKKIKLADLEPDHLKNILRWIERKSKEGLHVISGACGSCAEDMWADEDIYFGKTVKAKLNFSAYEIELEHRKIIDKTA